MVATNKKLIPSKPKPVINGDWINTLGANVGQYIKLETADGCYRDGRLSGLGCRTIKLNGVDEKIIVDVEINGDPQDRISIERIINIDVL